MAKAPTKTQNEKKVDTKPAATAGTSVAVANAMFAADAGAGMEGATQESFAIPFVSVLQKGSPQVDEASGVAIEGAKAGMFFDNVSGRMFDGKKGVVLVPCAYRRVFLRWAPKGTDGAGFKGEILPEDVAEMRARGQVVDLDGKLFVPLPDGTVNEKKCDRIGDTRNHYVLLMDEENGGWTQALVSLASTQIKKSKMLMSALAGVKVSGPNGLFTPPTFANLLRATSVPESNDKGTWHGIRFAIEGQVNRQEVYAAAKAFHASVAKGAVDVKYDETAASDASGGESKGF